MCSFVAFCSLLSLVVELFLKMKKILLELDELGVGENKTLPGILWNGLLLFFGGGERK